MKILLNRRKGMFRISHEFLLRIIQEGLEQFYYVEPQDPRGGNLLFLEKTLPYLQDGFQAHNSCTALLKEKKLYFPSISCTDRTNKDLIKIFELLGTKKASADYAQLEVIDIPEDVKKWKVTNEDGYEQVEEIYRIF